MCRYYDMYKNSLSHEHTSFLTIRAIDAINEPDRPIPSGAISENEVFCHVFYHSTLSVHIVYKNISLNH